MSLPKSYGIALGWPAGTGQKAVPSPPALLAYWSARSANVSGSLINTVPGRKARLISKTSDATRPTLTAGRMIFTAGSNTRLQENPAVLQPRKLTATTVVTLPDATGSDAGKGFTCTGGCTAPDGTRWAMNFGVPTELSGATPAPSLVHLSADLNSPTILAQYSLASISATLTTGVQGVGYDMVDDLVYFWGANNFWFVNPANGALVRSLPFTAFPVNGTDFDPATGNIVACATGNNTTLYWINKYTAALGRSVPIAGTAIDHLRFSGGYLWYSGGDNGSAQGGAIRQLDYSVVGSERVVGEWFTDAGAPEGLVEVNGAVVWLLNDGYYHNPPGDATNTVRRYVLDPVPGTYPGAGRVAVAAWVGNLVAATGGTTMAWSVGEPTSSGQRGIGVAFPASVTNSLRVYANNSFATFSVTTNVEAVWSVVWDFNAGTARLRKNGVDVATTAISGLSSTALYPTMQIMLGATREDTSLTRSSTSSLANLLIGYDPALVELYEGEVAWDAEVQALLPTGHAYKAAAPIY
ncbi:hypothetical protein [Caulobacter sp. BK020]|uniref:hypothetical protein n=1 Tax=Caulobacter sp. BK020 TaxID=2512117 RepID=UPI00104C4F7D|nr:hypothetical protein [Caulobacter sp. BK020]TCS14553.1 hypothetical protein EV278_107202 [Caulobacter sp. BK020]